MRTYEFPAKANAKTLEALREQGYYDMDFWRQVPPTLWKQLAKDDKFWKIETIGLARGITTSGSIALLDELNAEELHALFKLATSDAQVTVSYQNANKCLPTFVGLATTKAQLYALVRTCDKSQGTRFLFSAFTPEQIVHIKNAFLIPTAKKTGDYLADGAARTARWFYLTRADITAADFAALAELSPIDLFEVPHDPGLQWFAALRTRLAAAAPAIREWITTHLADEYALTRDRSPDVILPLWAAVLTGPADELVGAVLARLEAKKDDFRKERNREKLAKLLADALLASPDGPAVIAALRKGTKAKALQQVFDHAAELLTGALGQIGAAPIAWATMTPLEGSRVLTSSTDPRRTVDEGLATADGNSAIRIFQAVASYALDKRPTEPFGAGALWPLVLTILAKLDATFDANGPTELTHSLYNKKSATDEAFAFDVEILTRVLTGRQGAITTRMTEEQILAELRKLHAASTNARFRGLLATVLGEPFGDKLRRLAAQCADHKGGVVTRFFVERTDEAPTKSDINRLYGSPIGITAKTWPRSKKKAPMQHILTLETRLLSDDARSSLGDAVAVAVFLADINEPGGETALVPLSAANLNAKVEKPLVAPAIDGVRLKALELALPKAAFLGGKKTGALKELRVALDRLDGVLSTDQTSPRWIQDPEYAGDLIAQLDESFASKLNFGDSGAIYVMTEDVVFQCH